MVKKPQLKRLGRSCIGKDTMEFSIGDIVCLRSGGPSMTVMCITTPSVLASNGVDVECVWFADTELKQFLFLANMLDLDQRTQS